MSKVGDSPEAKARENIDKQLAACGWIVQSRDQANIMAGRGVAITYFPLKSGYGEADYLLYVDGAPAGVVEAKKEGETLTSFEIQTEKYSVGLPDQLKPYRKPLPFCYQSTGVETRFTNLMEPDARSRSVFCFHRPETFAAWLEEEAKSPGSKLRARLKHLPPLIAGQQRRIPFRTRPFQRCSRIGIDTFSAIPLRPSREMNDLRTHQHKGDIGRDSPAHASAILATVHRVQRVTQAFKCPNDTWRAVYGRSTLPTLPNYLGEVSAGGA
jgi:hypothetical protein